VEWALTCHALPCLPCLALPCLPCLLTVTSDYIIRPAIPRPGVLHAVAAILVHSPLTRPNTALCCTVMTVNSPRSHSLIRNANSLLSISSYEEGHVLLTVHCTGTRGRSDLTDEFVEYVPFNGLALLHPT
jgi:hypothetical protein